MAIDEYYRPRHLIENRIYVLQVPDCESEIILFLKSTEELNNEGKDKGLVRIQSLHSGTEAITHKNNIYMPRIAKVKRET